MTERERELFRARMRTLDQVRAEVWSPDGVTLKLRAVVHCSREIHGARKLFDFDGRVRTA